MFHVIVIGGGSYGVLAALQYSTLHPNHRIALFERRKQLLTYPDSEAEIQFENRNWTRNQILRALRETHVEVYRSSGVESIRIHEKSDQKQKSFEVITRRAVYKAQHVIAACGQDTGSLQMFAALGLITSPFQPATFYMRCDEARLKGIKLKDLNVALSWLKSGPPRKRIHIQLASPLPEVQPLSKAEGKISIQSGIVSGSAVRELSFHIAKQSEKLPERFKICINWLPDYGFQGVLEYMQVVARSEADKTVFRTQIFDLPRALWSRLATASGILQGDRWQDLMPIQFQEFATQLVESQFGMKPDLRASSVSNYQGGVHPNDLHLDRPECKIIPGLYFVGNILDYNINDIAGTDSVSSDEGLSWIKHIGANP